jgi:hypothetical protein
MMPAFIYYAAKQNAPCQETDGAGIQDGEM